MNALSERVAEVRARIAQVATRVGRSVDDVLLVAVSKTFGPEQVRAAYAAGLRHFGENRVQEARTKVSLCPDDIVWHMVGYLQTNKASWAARLFAWIHSIDRPALVDVLERACARYGRTMDALVEIRLSPEPTKHGCAEADLFPLVDRLVQCRHLRFVGLMTMPPWDPDPERARPYFRKLRAWRDTINEYLTERHAPLRIHHLSMGMSHDFEVAIEEGATIVRIGQAIFGPREEA